MDSGGGGGGGGGEGEGDGVAEDGASTSTEAGIVAALLPQDGDCVSIKWAGTTPCLCILRKDKSGCVIAAPPVLLAPSRN
jgi:hypothetical protein